MVPKKNCKGPKPAMEASAGPRTRISGAVLNRLIKEKMARTADCDGVSAMPIVRSDAAARGCNWTVPGYTGDGSRVSKCEAAISEYVDFLAAQFDLDDE